MRRRGEPVGEGGGAVLMGWALDEVEGLEYAKQCI